MKAAVIIPARYGATRLPGKPLLRRTGKYLIEHVWERARQAKAVQRVIIATDDARIEEAVRGFGGECRMTAAHHRSGTDRIAEVAREIEADVIVNVQGDEPEIDPETIDRVARAAGRGAPMSTAAAKLASEEEAADPNRVKVVVGGDGCALYFSRAAIPYDREGKVKFGEDSPYLLHIGIYGYEREFLLRYGALPRTELEEIEKLEQLRALAAGYKVRVVVVDRAPRGIDTLEDYEAFVRQQATIGRKP
ncbi:MAG: 3-deoxy-manno-octulosonate cytidylyltransferase [Planctomycetota bacterium]